MKTDSIQNEVCAEACDSRTVQRKGDYVQRLVRRWVWEKILTFYRKHLYRHVMKLAHRYNWHYAPPQRLMHGEKPDGQKRHWCQWCGLRGTTIDMEHFNAISPMKSPNEQVS